MTKLNSLQELFEAGISDIHDAEKQVLTAMPKLIRWVSDRNLKAVLESHFADTAEHVVRIEQVRSILGLQAEAITCAAMQAILKDGVDLLDRSASHPMLDAACIVVAHTIKHYEIGAYGMLMSACRLLEYPAVVFALLRTSEQEARSADTDLFEAAESGIFSEAIGNARLASE